MAGFLAQSLAETLASLAMINVIPPGFPMVFSNCPLVTDLRSGAFAGGGGETTRLNTVSAQPSNWLGVPSGVACFMTDGKAKEVLATHHPEYLSPDQDAQLKAAFEIID
jgi:trimethylamine--corrinoid protein Co-methyltransferase